MTYTRFKTALISLGIFTIASSTFALTQIATVKAQETPIYAQKQTDNIQDDIDMDLDYYLEDYKEGYRDGFLDGFKAALEELEAMYMEDEAYNEVYEYDEAYGDYGSDYDSDYGSDYGSEIEDDYGDLYEGAELLDKAPEGLSPTYLPEGLVFQDAYTFTDEDGVVDEAAFYFNEKTENYLDLSRFKISVEEASELYGEDVMTELADLPTKEIAGTLVYIEKMTEEGEDYITAYFSKADGLYTVDSNLSEAEMNIILSSLLEQ